jgi:hypothetical protein
MNPSRTKDLILSLRVKTSKTRVTIYGLGGCYARHDSDDFRHLAFGSYESSAYTVFFPSDWTGSGSTVIS